MCLSVDNITVKHYQTLSILIKIIYLIKHVLTREGTNQNLHKCIVMIAVFSPYDRSNSFEILKYIMKL